MTPKLIDLLKEIKVTKNNLGVLQNLLKQYYPDIEFEKIDNNHIHSYYKERFVLYFLLNKEKIQILNSKDHRKWKPFNFNQTKEIIDYLTKVYPPDQNLEEITVNTSDNKFIKGKHVEYIYNKLKDKYSEDDLYYDKENLMLSVKDKYLIFVLKGNIMISNLNRGKLYNNKIYNHPDQLINFILKKSPPTKQVDEIKINTNIKLDYKNAKYVEAVYNGSKNLEIQATFNLFPDYFYGLINFGNLCCLVPHGDTDFIYLFPTKWFSDISEKGFENLPGIIDYIEKLINQGEYKLITNR
jgi:hypothetical protein